MNTFTQKVKLLTAIAALMGATAIKAQLGITVNYGTNYQCLNGNNIVNAQVTNSVSGTTGYLWTVTSPPTCIATYTATGPAGEQVNISASCVGQYTVCCAALSGSTAIATQCSVFNIYPNPTVNISSSSSSSVPLCAGSGYTLTGSGAMTYTWMPFFSGATYVAYPASSTCYTLVGADPNGCTGAAVHCVSVMPSPVVSISGNATVCLGTSTCFTASGASSYAWSNGISGSTMCILPLIGNSYSVAGTGSNGCVGMAVVNVVVDSTCANVWPGDANSDGVVSSTDVLEIGLAYSSTGAPRTPGGNAYTSQYATAWSGFVSTWKNKCHADCNGDGTIDLNDTLAIYNNFSLTHPFKSSEASASGDINLGTLPGNNALSDSWNKVDILLGSSSSPMNQLYGVTFDINFDNALIQSNSAYIVYTNSFLNSSNQNVQFKKLNFTNGKVYAASVRTDGNNVNGSGKIGEFWFKTKPDASSSLNISVSNVSSINKNGVTTSLAGSSSVYNVVASGTGLKEQSVFEQAVGFFPNPAANQLTLESGINGTVSYIICDITGRVVVKGEFTDSKTIDISALSAGSYIIKFQAGTLSSHKKVVIDK